MNLQTHSSKHHTSRSRNGQAGIVHYGFFLHVIFSLVVGLFLFETTTVLRGDDVAVDLPAGVKAVWEVEGAHHENTPTRERICLNGLWRWQPAESGEVPAGRWGYFKVPGPWPGITDYMQKDSQRLYSHPAWALTNFASIQEAWYEREFTVPANWTGRSVSLEAETVNSLAEVYVDGSKVGEIPFPGGELDLSAVSKPGSRHRVSLRLFALPLKGVLLSYTDTAAAREVRGTVERRGLCGDVFLVSRPAGPRITDVRVETSVRQRHLSVQATLKDHAPETRYELRVRVTTNGALVREFSSPPRQGADISDGAFEFTHPWFPSTLWDLNAPENQFDIQVSLAETGGRLCDTYWTQRSGFREFWIEGRDFFLNGTRIFLSAVPLDNAQVSAAAASYSAARESLERLKSIGINYVYTHNYGCEPGSHLNFTEILRAADDVGMLVGFSQPHFSHYDWKDSQADQSNGYERHAESYVHTAGNHPSVVMYVMSHNATGYEEDMNPDMIDGLLERRDSWAQRNVSQAVRAEAIVQRLDPHRIVYHHASGNLGAIHNSNFYPNFAPIQELDDWFEHWSGHGVKPAFTCEYGAPFTWDWTMYRGWYQGRREWGSARVPWEFCLAEWNAQFLGDAAYRISDAEKANLRWEAAQLRAGKVWHRWDYPNPVGSDRFDERYPVFASYITSNWRAFRTWGVSGVSPWEFEHFWKLRPGVDRSLKELPVDWDHIQRPGFSPDYLGQRYERMDLAYDRADWVATPAALALIRNNRPLLACIAGKSAAVTSKDHNFVPGESVEKQIVVINNSRVAVDCNLHWSLNLPQPMMGSRQVSMPTGDQQRIPIRIDLPSTLAPANYTLKLSAKFSSGDTQEDEFQIHLLKTSGKLDERPAAGRLALFDPKGQTANLLEGLGLPARPIAADAELSTGETLVIGRGALTPNGPAPDIRRVRDGLKVIVFEQTAEALEQRLGFRVAEYGLRQVFPRIAGHPLIDGFTAESLRDWRGSATLLPERLNYEMRPQHGPTVRWAGLQVSRVWRCGNRGNVASVLIEKPARGDFLPALDGGFGLQYSPLLEFRDGKGVVIFCQLDVTGRTESDPAARIIVQNLLRYISHWKPSPRRAPVYAGDPAGFAHLESIGLAPRHFNGGRLTTNEALILGPGSGKARSDLHDVLASAGDWMGIGLAAEDLAALHMTDISTRIGEHIAGYFEPGGPESWLAGIGPADIHNRDPRELPLLAAGVAAVGNGVLGRRDSGAFLQMAPWQFGNSKQPNLRRTFRRASFLLSRLLANMGVAGETPLLERFRNPVDTTRTEQRWLDGLYLDHPEEWDDPYRFFRW